MLAVLRELHHVKPIARARPDEPVVIDVDPVLGVIPGVALARATPGSENLTLRIELENWRCRKAAIGDRWLHRGSDLLRREARRHVDHPEVIVVVDEQPSDVPQDPVVRKRRWPGWIHLVDGKIIRCRRARRRLGIGSLGAGLAGYEKHQYRGDEFQRMSHDRKAPS